MANADDEVRRIYEFGPYQLDPADRVLLRAGEQVPLTPKAFETLALLVTRNGSLVTKEEMLGEIWPDTFVEEGNLAVHISALRRVFRETPGGDAFIETVPKRGYRFRAPVRVVERDREGADEPSPVSRLISDKAVDTRIADTPTPDMVRTSVAIRWRRWLAALAVVPIFVAVLVWRSASPRFEEPAAPYAEARRLCVQGRYFWAKRTPEGFTKAIDLFETAIDADPGYGPAYAGLADCYLLLGPFGVLPPDESFPKAKAAASRALEIDPGLAEAHATLGYALALYDWDWDSAERELRAASAIAPENASAHQWYAVVLSSTGRPEEALVEVQRARELDPLSPMIASDFAVTLSGLGRHDEAIAELRAITSAHPSFGWARENLGIALVEKGMYPEAVAELERAMELEGEDPANVRVVREAFERGGMEDYWRARVAQLEAREVHGELQAYAIATIYARLRMADEAFRWLERAVAARDSALVNTSSDSAFAAIRSDARFARLLDRLGQRLPP